MIRQKLQIKVYNSSWCQRRKTNRLPKRLLKLQSLIMVVMVTIRNISAYPILGSFKMHATSSKVKSAIIISRMSYRHSSTLLLQPITRRSLQRLYWKPETTDENFRWQQQRQNVGSFSAWTLPTIIGQSATMSTSAYTPVTKLEVHKNIRDADIVEMLIGGERYSLVPMPKAMKATTIFVGNICEFVQDSDLSTYFSQVSSLTSVPSCVVRKVNTQSMGYGFVSFPNVDEKEAAIARFHDSEWRGKRLKVEAIRDDTAIVRIPEYMVEYVYGPTKKHRNDSNGDNSKSSKSNKKNDDEVKVQRISKDDVERLSRGQPSKRRGYGSRNVPHRLNEDERQELDRAARKGYLTLIGGGNRRTRKGSPLKNIHRQWCDARDCPQILLYKAVGGKAIDEVVIDLSPLRLHGLFDTPELVEDFLVRWKAQILSAAYESKMELLDSTSLSLDDDDDECATFSSDIDNDDDSERDCVEEVKIPTVYTVTLQALDQQAWATNPIWQLPVVSLGLFQGERANAKSMASTLAKLWNIPEVIAMNDVSSSSEYSGTTGHGPKSRRDAGANKGGHTKVKGLQEHRKRGGGHRQAW